jgi:hypothetical protein
VKPDVGDVQAGPGAGVPQLPRLGTPRPRNPGARPPGGSAAPPQPQFLEGLVIQLGDARNGGFDDIASFFEQVMKEDSERAAKCH